MLRFVLVRLVHGLVVVFLVTTLVFVILHLAPRDPVTLLIGEARMTPSRSSTSAASGGSTSRLHIQCLRWAAHRAVRRHSRRDTARFGWLFVEDRMRPPVLPARQSTTRVGHRILLGRGFGMVARNQFRAMV